MDEKMFAAVGSTLRAVGLFAMLLVTAAGAGAADRPQPMESGQAAAARRAVAALLPRLNADIGAGAWVEGTGVLMTPSVTIAQDGRLEVHGLVCRGDRVPDARFIDACRRGQMAGRARVLLIDPAGIDAAVTGRTRAIMPVHHGGSPVEMDGVMAAAQRHGLRVVEDAAQAHGAAWRGRPVGAIGDIGVFSFQSTKPINAGEGGMMVTDDDTLDELLWSYRNVGRRRGGEWYEHVRLGWNLRMSEFQAAVLIAQMRRMPAQQQQRTEAAAYLSDRLRQIPGVVPLKVPDGVTAHSWYTYHWRWLGAADGGLPKMAFAEALRAEGIPLFHGYTPLNRNAAVRAEIARLGGAEPAACPNAERAEAEEILMFAMPILLGTREDLDDVVRAVAKVAQVRA